MLSYKVQKANYTSKLLADLCFVFTWFYNMIMGLCFCCSFYKCAFEYCFKVCIFCCNHYNYEIFCFIYIYGFLTERLNMYLFISYLKSILSVQTLLEQGKNGISLESWIYSQRPKRSILFPRKGLSVPCSVVPTFKSQHSVLFE